MISLMSNDVIDIYTRGDNIVKYLTTENKLCPHMKLGDVLGVGGSGTVMKLLPSDDVVVKEFNYILDTIPNNRNQTVRQFSESLEEWPDYKDAFIRINGGLDATPTQFMLPEFVQPCAGRTPLDYVSNVGGEDRLVEPPYYVCDSGGEQYSEFIISTLVSALNHPNFVKSNDFITCYPSDRPHQYMVMERMITSLAEQATDFRILDDGDVSDSIFVQCLCAIAVYQETYKISHNDLHPGNIFLQPYVGVEDYFHYNIKGVDIYVPNEGFVVKIGDWSEAIKWTTPVIASSSSLYGDTVPNVYIPAYDVMLLVMSFLHLRADSPLPGRVFESMTGLDSASFRSLTMAGYKARPGLSIFTDIVKPDIDATSILTSVKLMSKFYERQ